MKNLDKFFNPQSIAIVGASEEAGKIGNILAKNLLDLGYGGKVFFVNQKHTKLFDQECYNSLNDIKEEVDLAILAIPAKFVNEVVQKSASKVKNFIIISAGFSETDEEGKRREKELADITEKNQLNILGPNCLGFIAPKLNLNASFSSGMAKAGNISFVSQSGALISAVMDISNAENFGFSHIVSIGNKMDIDEAQMLEFLAIDPETKVIGMYLEGIKDGARFMEVAQKVSLEKPVVILKAGKTQKAQIAIASHTGALAGSDEVMEAVFEKAGVIRANDLEEFFGILKIISNAKELTSNKVAVVTNAGGAGVLTTDAFYQKEIELAELSAETKKELKSFLPAESSVLNPVDLLGDALEDRYQKSLAVLDKEPEIGMIVILLTPQNQTPVKKIAQALIEFKKTSQKNLVAIFIGGEKISQAVQLLNDNGVAVFDVPEKAIGALEKYYLWQKNARQRIFSRVKRTHDGRRENVLHIIEKARKEGRKALRFEEARRIFYLYDIDACKVWEVEPGNMPEGNFKFPVVVKIDSDRILHKSDHQALILNIKNLESLYAATAKISGSFPGEKIIIQEMAEKGTEIICGIKKDPTFGPIIVFGLGGIYTEVFKMVNLLVPSVGEEEIIQFLAKSKLEFLFKGARGQMPYNMREFAKILEKIQSLALEIPEILELDVNPLFIYNDGKPAVAVDIKIIL